MTALEQSCTSISPPLPEAQHFYFAPEDSRVVRKPLHLFTSEQMRDYVAADRAQRQAEQAAALTTLHSLGYTFIGGERWKPPVGPSAAPLLGKIDAKDAEIAALRQDEKRLALLNLIMIELDSYLRMGESHRDGMVPVKAIRDLISAAAIAQAVPR